MKAKLGNQLSSQSRIQSQLQTAVLLRPRWPDPRNFNAQGNADQPFQFSNDYVLAPLPELPPELSMAGRKKEGGGAEGGGGGGGEAEAGGEPAE